MYEQIIKHGFTDASVIKQLNSAEVQAELASPHIIQQLEKFANTIRAIAPKSDDFLYFSIIFLKAAEAALIDDYGETKKIAFNEKAWGYFDDNWKWHGNVKPHKNQNGDIFPERELKIAFRDWIGKPLCVDHKSDSVDGIRGIILDTYYDEKLKQVIGLCALDKVNYPDLARNVKTGVVRYGSMGTAVNLSICTECSKKAATPKEYCPCILNKKAWGEINVGLKPIEYSLVVQPAEPGAKLLRCIASIGKHDKELQAIGVNCDNLVKNLNAQQADDLDLLLNSVCSGNGCSIEQRERIIRGFLSTNGFTKSASVKKSSYDKELLQDLARFEDVFGVKYTEDPELYEKFFGDDIGAVRTLPPAADESLTSGQNVHGGDTITMKDDHDVSDLTGTGSSGLTSGVTEPNLDSFKTDGVGPEHYAYADDTLDNIKISAITEEIMNEARKRKRAELRRRLAHPLGASNPNPEPSTFKDEGARQEKMREQDKHMLQTKSMGGESGVFPGDEKLKEKLLRAEEKAADIQKNSYFQGGADPSVEPSTFKSEDYHKYWDMDKHMHQTKTMGGDKGSFPGDEKVKQNLKRAKYTGPVLSTKFKQRKALDGSINKEASCLEIYSGDKLVIAATAKDIFGKEVEKYWSWLTSQEYAKKVVATIREEGVDYVGTLLTKKAQELPAAPPLEEPEAPMDMGALGEPEPMEMESMEPLPDDAGLEDGSPKTEVEDALISMEDSIEKAREALSNLTGGEDVNVDINVGQDPEMPEEKLALSREIVNQLKVVIADARDSADELALLAETYEKVAKLSQAQRKELNALRSDAMIDYGTITGRTNVLVSMAKTIANTLVKTSEYVETKTVKASKPAAPAKESASLVSGALELRKLRRQDLLKKASEQMKEEAEEKEVSENEAHDGIGMKENAPVAGVTSDTAKDVADRAPKGPAEHSPAPSKGNADAKQFSTYPSTPVRDLAEKAVSINHAEDSKAEEKEEEVKEDKSTVQAKLTESFMKKKSEEELDLYRTKLRRAYDVAMEMQRKGMLQPTKPALDRQVDCIMEFSDVAFEAFKRSIANSQPIKNVKTATDLSGVNIGINEDEPTETAPNKGNLSAADLAKMWS